MKLTLLERLLWSITPLVVGAFLPAALTYWVASHGFRIALADSFATVASYYARPFDNLVVAAICHFPPFVLLALITFIVSRRATPRWLAVLFVAGFTLIMLPMVPRSIHTLKDTYRRDNSGEGSEFVHFGTGVLSSASLLIGLWFLTVAHHHFLIPREPKNAS